MNGYPQAAHGVTGWCVDFEDEFRRCFPNEKAFTRPFEKIIKEAKARAFASCGAGFNEEK